MCSGQSFSGILHEARRDDEDKDMASGGVCIAGLFYYSLSKV